MSHTFLGLLEGNLCVEEKSKDQKPNVGFHKWGTPKWMVNFMENP